MDLAEAVEEFERDMVVVDQVGYQRSDDRGLDSSRAPNGDTYVVLTSCGETRAGQAFPGWYADEDTAAREWLRQAWLYAEERGGGAVYWKARPAMISVDFVALDQAALIGDPMLRGNVSVTLWCVVSSLAIARVAKEA